MPNLETIATLLTFKMYSGGRDQPVWGLLGHPSLSPPPPPTRALCSSVTARVDRVSICASTWHLACKCVPRNQGSKCAYMRKQRHICAHVNEAVVLPKDSVSLGLLCLTCANLVQETGSGRSSPMQVKTGHFGATDAHLHLSYTFPS